MADVERLHALDLDQVSFVRESLQVLRSTVDQQVGTPEHSLERMLVRALSPLR